MWIIVNSDFDEDCANILMDEDGEAMKESSNGHRTQGENDPDSGDGNDANGEEIKESGTIRLKDIVNGIVGTGAVGKLRRK